MLHNHFCKCCVSLIWALGKLSRSECRPALARLLVSAAVLKDQRSPRRASLRALVLLLCDCVFFFFNLLLVRTAELLDLSRLLPRVILVGVFLLIREGNIFIAVPYRTVLHRLALTFQTRQSASRPFLLCSCVLCFAAACFYCQRVLLFVPKKYVLKISAGSGVVRFPPWEKSISLSQSVKCWAFTPL